MVEIQTNHLSLNEVGIPLQIFLCSPLQGSFNDQCEMEEDKLVHSLTPPQSLRDKRTAASQESYLPMIDAIRQHLQHPEVDRQPVPWLTPILQNVIDKLASSAAPLHLPATNVPCNRKIERQLRFTSTNCKPETIATARMAKPTRLEQDTFMKCSLYLLALQSGPHCV